MTFEYVLLILLLITTMIILNESLQETLATSPSFVRQEMRDELNDDGWNYLTAEFTTGHKYADLSSITYLSNGKFLNATLFFNHNITIRPLTANYTAYGMLIDVDADSNTGWQGYDYMMKVSWENNTKNWTYELQEWSGDSTTRTLENRSNFTSFLDNNQGKYVYLSLDLQKINFPDKCAILFFTDYDFQEGDIKYEISDFSEVVRVPPPKILLAASPNSLSISPGEKKSVEIQLNSSALGIVNLSTSQIDGLQTYFSPNERELSPIGFAATHLIIKASPFLEPNPYTLQIFANMIFPKQYSGAEINPAIILPQNASGHSNLPIVVLNLGEQFSNFWATYGDPISLIAGGFAAGFAALVFGKLSKKYKVQS